MFLIHGKNCTESFALYQHSEPRSFPAVTFSKEEEAYLTVLQPVESKRGEMVPIISVHVLLATTCVTPMSATRTRKSEFLCIIHRAPEKGEQLRS